MNQTPATFACDAPATPSVDQLRGVLERAVDFLLRWQIGVMVHVEDFWDDSHGEWVKRPCFGWMCGSFAGDWIKHGPRDPTDTQWRMAPGLTWHTGQAILALSKAQPLVNAPGLERAIAEGAQFIGRLQLLDGRNRGAFWTPPHGLPADWKDQLGAPALYYDPWKNRPAGTRLLNSDMCESISGWLAAGRLLRDRAAIEGCRRWGEWFAREADLPEGCCYHDFDDKTGDRFERSWFWAMDDGVQGLLGAYFNEERWINSYLEKVDRLLQTPIRLEDLPAQQARTFYWNASLLQPILERHITARFDEAVVKFIEYTEWLLGLIGEDGMAAFKYSDDGVADHDCAKSAGDGAATAMAARMCYLLWQATGDARWRTDAQPMLRWIKNAQLASTEGAMAGGIPFTRQLIDPQSGRPFQFKRLISTVFAIHTLSEWLSEEAS